MTDDPAEQRGSTPPADVERRRSDRRSGEDRRKQDVGPPDGLERRRAQRRERERRRS